MVYCPSCGNPNDDAAKFCIKCGHSLEVHPETTGTAQKPPGGRGGIGRTAIVALLALVVVGVIAVVAYLLAQGMKSGGDWIAYQTEYLGYERSLWVVRPDGEAPIEVLGEYRGIAYTSVPRGKQRSEYTPFAPNGKRMLFTVYDGNEASLYTYVLGDDEAERIVRGEEELEHRFSPDGERIAVEVRDEDGERSLLVMDVDGENQVTLFSGDEHSVAWDWLPNSRQLIVKRYDRDYTLYVTDADGKDQVTLAEDLDGVYYIVSLAGNRIAYVVEEDGEWDLYVADADGSDVTLLESGLADVELFDFSPDGKQFLVNTTADWDSYDLKVMDSGGTDQVTLVRDEERAYGGFCPDGKRIWYLIWEGGYQSLYLADADGEEEDRVERDIDDWEMEFTPDGRTMIVGLEQDGDWNLYAVEVATGKEVMLFSNTDDLGLLLVKDNKQVLFSVGDLGEESLYIAQLDGEEILELAGPVYEIPGYDISPDRRRIVYSEQTSGYRLYTIDLDGENREELVDDGFWPHWSD